jgi:type I site-specific restriction endonuclease
MPRAFGSGALIYNVEQYSAALQDLSAAVKRDSFIVAQMVAAAGELHDDFQKHAALEKAHDHIELAMRKANDNPPATAEVRTAVSQANDIVDHWRDNATSADLNDIDRQLLKKTNDVQPVLFRELDEVRKNKLALKDVLAKLGMANDLLDDAMNDALVSTLDFFRAGGGRL